VAEIVKTWAYTVRRGINRRKKIVALVKPTNTERFHGIADAFFFFSVGRCCYLRLGHWLTNSCK